MDSGYDRNHNEDIMDFRQCKVYSITTKPKPYQIDGDDIGSFYDLEYVDSDGDYNNDIRNDDTMPDINDDYDSDNYDGSYDYDDCTSVDLEVKLAKNRRMIKDGVPHLYQAFEGIYSIDQVSDRTKLTLSEIILAISGTLKYEKDSGPSSTVSKNSRLIR